MGYVWRAEARQREAEVAAELASIRAFLMAREGWGRGVPLALEDGGEALCSRKCSRWTCLLARKYTAFTSLAGEMRKHLQAL